MQGLQAGLTQAMRLAAVERLAHELNADLGLADALKRVLNVVAETLGTPFASIVDLKDKNVLAAYALGGGERDPLPSIRRVLENGLAGNVMHNQRTIIIDDILQNALWLALPDDPLSPQTGSALCMPLLHAGEVVGVMTLAHPANGYFNADVVSLATVMGEMASPALVGARVRDAARQAEERYAAIFNDVTLPVLMIDLQGHICAANRQACEFLGYAREELLRQPIATIHRAGAGPLALDCLDSLVRGAETRFESTVWTKDGSERIVQVVAKRVHGITGGDRIHWIEQDITPQHTLERLQRDLSAMIYHDMRGPLGNVYTSLQALQKLLDNPTTDPNVMTLLKVAARSERQVRRMIDSLLDIQRLEEGKKLIHRASTVLNTVIANALEQMQSQAHDNKIELRFALSDDLPALYIDGEMIERVIINLLDNAIKYSPPGGNVTVSTATSGSEVYVRVKDTGPGIPPEAQHLIFDKYARVKQRNMPPGVGLGLAFCKLAVEAHGGRIWVRSNGSGSLFTFALPVQAPATHELPSLVN